MVGLRHGVEIDMKQKRQQIIMMSLGTTMNNWEQIKRELPEFRDFVDDIDDVFREVDNDAKNKAVLNGEKNYKIVNKMEWPTMSSCRIFLRNHAINHKFEFK